MRPDDGAHDLAHDLCFGALLQNEVAQPVAVLGTVGVDDIHRASGIAQFVDDALGKRAHRLLASRDLADDRKAALLVDGEHGFEPQERPRDRRHARASAAALQVHEIVHREVDVDAAGEVLQKGEELLVGSARLFALRRLLRLDARAQRDVPRIEHRTLAVGELLFQFLQGKVERLKGAAQLVREGDVEHVLAPFKVGRQDALVILGIERLRLGDLPRAHFVVKFTEVRRLAEVIAILLAVDIIGHGDVVEPELFGTGMPEFAVGIKNEYAHKISPMIFDRDVIVLFYAFFRHLSTG